MLPLLLMLACGGADAPPSSSPVTDAAPAAAHTPAPAAQEPGTPREVALPEDPVPPAPAGATPAEPVEAEASREAAGTAEAPVPSVPSPSPPPMDAPLQVDAEPETEQPAPADATRTVVDPQTEDVATPLPAPVTARSYAVDRGRSWVYVVVRFDPAALAVKLGHDHMVAATRYDAAITWHPADPSQCRVSFTIPVASLEPDPPGGRERAGLDALDAVSAKALGSIRENFRAKKQLDMASYPEIRFQSTSCDGTSGRVKVTGDLTLRGVTKPITAAMEVTLDGEDFRATGGFRTTHSAFGFQPYSNLAGAFRNLDELSFTIDVRATASPS